MDGRTDRPSYRKEGGEEAFIICARKKKAKRQQKSLPQQK